MSATFATAAPKPSLRDRVSGVDQVMTLVSGVLLPLGLVMVLLSWYGASHTPYLFEQIPYLISGGLLGLGFVLVGGFLLFAAWIARTAREQRAASAELLEVMIAIREELRDLPVAQAAPAARTRRAANGSTSSGSNGNGLVVTAHGSMLHRPDCAVVLNREDLHAVTVKERAGLQPCRLCDPLATGARPVRA